MYALCEDQYSRQCNPTPKMKTNDKFKGMMEIGPCDDMFLSLWKDTVLNLNKHEL